MDILYLFIHSSIDWCLNCFHFLAIMNNAAMHIHWQVFVWINVLILLDIYLGTQLFDHMITLSLIFEELLGFFQSGCTTLQLASNVWQLQFHYVFFLYVSVFCIITILVWAMWYLIVVLILLFPGWLIMSSIFSYDISF